MGVDGTKYYFTVNYFDQKTGVIWSAPESSILGKLVEIGYRLVDEAIGLGSKVNLES